MIENTEFEYDPDTFVYDPNNWEDPVLQEIHWMRAQQANYFNYDIYAIARDNKSRAKMMQAERENQKQEGNLILRSF